LATLALAGALTACAADVYPPSVGGYATVSVDTVPPDIYAYPHVAYEGSNAYLVNDTWYYPTPRGWVKLHHESPELARYRADYRPAPPREERREDPRAPEVRRVEPERTAPAPPAYSYPPGR
jgi:hypothetical protein